jgi:LmbE family N-acetylglucosaminyl deacetylase
MTTPDIPPAALEGSVLIVAHPDDEILWFGSIAPQVERIVFCFSNDPAKPELKAAREKTLGAHPWSGRITCLDFDETGAFSLAGWPLPDASDSGLRLENAGSVAAAYDSRYEQIHEAVAPIVREAANIYTHNPWGEYGHEEHVLVHRAVTTLAEKHGKPVWYDNYASNWSEELMRRYMDRTDRQTTRGDVDVALMQELADVYKKHGSWTWFEDYSWFAEEFFVQGPLPRIDQAGFGWLLPINMLWLPQRDKPAQPRKKSGFRRIIRKIIRR